MGNWVAFNACTRNESWQSSARVVLQRHYNCTDDADVVLITVYGGGHTWPGSAYPFQFKTSGYTTQEIKADKQIWQFFEKHARVPVAPAGIGAGIDYPQLWVDPQDANNVELMPNMYRLLMLHGLSLGGLIAAS